MDLRRKSRWISHKSFAGSNATSWPCEQNGDSNTSQHQGFLLKDNTQEEYNHRSL
jgi:hypothetical protein